MHGNVEFIVEGSSPDGGVGGAGAYAGPEEVGFAVGMWEEERSEGVRSGDGARRRPTRSTPSGYAAAERSRLSRSTKVPSRTPLRMAIACWKTSSSTPCAAWSALAMTVKMTARRCSEHFKRTDVE